MSSEARYVDPSDFAAEGGAEGDVNAESEVAPKHVEAEAVEPAQMGDMGSVSRWTRVRDMMLSTDPSPPLAEVEDPWNPEEGGVTRIKRGFQKALGYDALPAVADVLIGMLEWAKTAKLEGGAPDAGGSDGGGGSSGGGGEHTDAEDPITAAAKDPNE